MKDLKGTSTDFSFYKCEGSFCGNKYSIEKEATEEPCCPICGSYYFSYIADRIIEI